MGISISMVHTHLDSSAMVHLSLSLFAKYDWPINVSNSVTPCGLEKQVHNLNSKYNFDHHFAAAEKYIIQEQLLILGEGST